MSSTNSHTTIEILLLFQSLAIHGTDTKAFTRTSEILTSNIILRESSFYNPVRYTIDALRILYLLTLAQELQAEAVGRDVHNNIPKRPITPPPNNLQDAARYQDKLPKLVAKYHLRYREEVIRAIRQEEQRVDLLQREIAEIERGEWDSKLVKEGAAAKLSRQNSYNSLDKERFSGKSATPRGSPHLSRSQTSNSSPRPEGLTISDVLNNTSDTAASSRAQSREIYPSIQHSAHSTHSRTPSIDKSRPQYPSSKDWQWTNHFQNGQPQQQQHQNSIPGQNSPRSGYSHQSPSTHSGSLPSPYETTLPTHRNSLPSPHDLPGSTNMSPASPGQIILPPPPSSDRASSTSVASHDASADLADYEQRRAPGLYSRQTQQPVEGSNHSQYGLQFSAQHPPMNSRSLGQGNPHRQQHVSGYSPSQHPTPLPQASQHGTHPKQSHGPTQSASRTVQTSVNAKTQLRQYNSPYVPGQNHGSSLSAQESSNINITRARKESIPQTPLSTRNSHMSGRGTRWTPNTSGSTPKVHREYPRPAHEPLSPELPSTRELANTTSTNKLLKLDTQLDFEHMQDNNTSSKTSASKVRGKTMSLRHGGTHADSTASSINTASTRSVSATSHADELSLDNEGTSSKFFKQEPATPKPFEDLDSIIVDQSSTHDEHSTRLQGLVGSPRRPIKRKRDTSAARTTPSPVTHVAWTRNFPKICASAIEHIGAHRNASLFALPLKERAAPGYKDLILRPQDLKAIRSAIIAGNKAGNTILNNMEDSGAPYVSLPWSEDLVPPKGIVNNAQLEKELMRMFANAIMYNPDPKRGVGSAFEREDEFGTDDVVNSGMEGYELDADGIVKDTKVMFADVQKIVSEMRVAERRVTESITSADGSEVEDDVDELAGDETADRKRRRRL